jgi:uncharacterized protein YbjT (DUF2867 family)
MQTIVVIGATGAQGGGVVRTLSAKGGYAIKAVTRKMESEKAKALAALEFQFANFVQQRAP